LRVSVASGIKNPTFHLISVDAQPIRAVDVQSTGDGAFIGVIEPPRSVESSNPIHRAPSP
jgi:hypothetical protein